MKKGFLLFILLFVSMFLHAQEVSSVIEKELQEEMSIRKSDELISVNIFLKAQYDQMEMRSKSDFYSTKEAKREFVVNELKSFSKATQAPILDLLNGMSKNHEVKDLKTHWLANMITCDIPVAVIEELATREEVLILGFNKEQYLLFDEKSTPVDNTKELTQNIYQVKAEQVWDLGYTGEGIIVAVIDTGVNYNHLDVADHLWDGGEEFPHHGWDCYNNDNDPMDDMGHGSHCAGTVLGDGTAGKVTGMAPDATLMCIKVLNAGGNGDLGHIVGGIEFAVEHGAHIFSMSLGFHGGGTESERIGFRIACVNSLEAGVVGAIAAGNEYGTNPPIPNNVRVPGNCPPPWIHPDQTTTGGTSCCICIGAVDYNDNAAAFTSRGPVTWQHIPGYEDYPYNPGMGLIRPDVCAPGVDIISLNYSSNTGYTEMSGTSMATPCAAGVMALMMSKNEDLTPAEICEILETTGVKLSETKSNTFGSCRIDALAAVDEVTRGPIIIDKFEVNDVNSGNNDAKLNPGETVSLNLTLNNIAEYSVNDVVAILTTENENVEITDSIANLGNFQIGETIQFDNQFEFTTSEQTTIGEDLKFMMFFQMDTDTIKYRLSITTYDYKFDLNRITVDDTETGNGNGILEAGETADIYFNITNNGNQEAYNVVGNLTTSSEYVTINSNEGTFGTFAPNGQTRYAHFNVTVSDDLPTVITPMPFVLTMTDEAGRATEIASDFVNSCDVVFTLRDSGGNGWEGAVLTVHFDDETPSIDMTVPQDESEFISTLNISYSTTVSLTWECGSNDNECTIDIDYAAGGHIYSTCCSHAGVFFSWENACLGNLTTIYPAPINLEAQAIGTNVKLTWETSAKNDFIGFNVYRDNVLIADSIMETEFTDYDLPLGIYSYNVDAIYEGGFASEPSETVSVEVTDTTLFGDADGNGEVNIADISITIAYMMENNPQGFVIENADVNGDGIINILDIMKMAIIIVNSK